MAPQLKLEVYRRLDNRFENLPDDSPRAIELHKRRAAALHEVFDSTAAVQVLDWGDTDDGASHELVELVVSGTLAAAAVLTPIAVPALTSLGKKLAEKAIDQASSEAVKAIISWLKPKQEEKKILDFTLVLPDGTRITIPPPDGPARIIVTFANSGNVSIDYTTGAIVP
jgi:hypothetical protein